MRAYSHEIDFIRKEGVQFRFHARPVRVVAERGLVTGVACASSKGPDVGLDDVGIDEGPEFVIAADQVVKAIGQEKASLAQTLGLALQRGYIQVNAHFETSISGVFAGGDCIRFKNAASTVMAVQDGKLAAEAIHARVTNSEVKSRV